MPKDSLLGAFWDGLGGILGGFFGTFWDIVGKSFLICFCVCGWGVVEAAPKARAKTTGIEETLLGSHHHLKCSC